MKHIKLYETFWEKVFGDFNPGAVIIMKGVKAEDPEEICVVAPRQKFEDDDYYVFHIGTISKDEKSGDFDPDTEKQIHVKDPKTRKITSEEQKKIEQYFKDNKEVKDAIEKQLGRNWKIHF